VRQSCGTRDLTSSRPAPKVCFDFRPGGLVGANYAAVLVVLQIAAEFSHCTTNVQSFFQFNATWWRNVYSPLLFVG
jgi:hypothetical protein